MSDQAEEIARLLECQPDLRALEILLPDLNGVLRGKRVTREELESVYREGLNLPASTQILDSRGFVIGGLGYGTDDGDPDYLCRPVRGTLAPVPWLASPVAQCLLQMYGADDRPFFADCRGVLQGVMARLAESGWRATVAVELEFYLLEDDLTIPPVPASGRIPGTDRRQRNPQMYSLEDLQERDALFTAIEQACEIQGVPASTTISEYAPGQFEINLRHIADAAVACDHAVLLRRLIRGVAGRHGLAATFMAKPFSPLGGSGMHVHVSLQDETGANLMVTDPAAAGHAAAGLIATLPETMAILCPNANSYRRLQPGCFAPVAANWGRNHRNLAVRMPLSAAADTRLEHRVAGADANPYLVVAAVLAGMHHGLVNRLTPPPMVAEGEVIEERVGLPVRWDRALAEFTAGSVLPGYLGAEFCRVFAAARRFECDAWHREVGIKDYDWYLRTI